MEKIQMDAILAAQTMSQTSRYQTTDLTKTDFSKLLKGQNTAASQTRDAKTPEKPSPKKDSEAVKDTGAKEPTDTDTEESEETKDSETIPAELLLQLQEAAGLLTAQPTQTECIESELTEMTGQEVTVESIPEPVTQEPGQAEGVMPTVPEEGIPESVVPEENLPKEPVAPALETAGLTVEDVQATPQKQPVQEAQTESVKADSPKEGPKETKVPEDSQASSEPQAKEETTVPVKAQTESQSGSQTKEETQPQQAFSGMEHLQLRNSSVGEVKGADAATATVRTTETTLVEDVGRTLAERFPQKDGMLTIELEPASLGKLTVQVLYEGGRAMVSILATNPKTLELLSQKASELGAILEEHTGQETIVYTEQPEAEQPYDERQREGERREQEPDSEEQQSDRASQESFAQQLRLGLL